MRKRLQSFRVEYDLGHSAPRRTFGVWLGAKSFKGTDPAVFRKWVLVILAVLAVLTAMKGLYALQT